MDFTLEKPVAKPKIINKAVLRHICKVYLVIFVVACPIICLSLIRYYYEHGLQVKVVAVKETYPIPAPGFAQCSAINDDIKLDCFPQGVASETLCTKRGCCWKIPKSDISVSQVPYCFYPQDYTLYKFLNVTSTDYGVTGFLNRTSSSPYVLDIDVLKLDVRFETETRLNIKLFDPISKRFEPPIPEVPILDSATKNAQYTVNINKSLPSLNVVRRSNNKVLFETTSAGFTFADQFLQLSAILSTKNIYGLGFHRNDFLLSTEWQTITMFNGDQPPVDNTNLYASHPFFIAIEDDGSAFGVLLLNSNAMDIILQPAPAITYRTIGGIFNFYFFLGPSPLEVIEQYSDLIGRPLMPPYWSLGFHLCRFGYQNLDDAKNILKKNLDAGVFVDTQWLDIDYMKNRNDFTHDEINFKGMKKFVEDLHEEGRHFVVILDPGVSASEPKGSYPPFDDAVKMDVLVKDYTGLSPIVGKVWNPKTTVFPDFTHPNATNYWLKQIQQMYEKQFQFDGLWIDMNDPSNFVEGSVNGCLNVSLENPPYLPRVKGGMLRSNTLCMTAKHYWGNHYDVHNLVGMTEAVATNFALTEVTKKRPFVISRSSFVGQGKYSGVWTGDVFSTWDDMYHSIPDIMTYNLLGIPMVGADICGFNGNTTVALCQRWIQLGAFYPFSRSHNEDSAIAQDPATLGPDVVASFKKAFNVRYTLLPYLYTLFWTAHIKGHPVVRPLFFEFPADKATFPISKQFLWGSAVHIIPVLQEGMTYVKGYFPKSRWFNYYTYEELVNHGGEISISAPLDTIPVFLRGGHIIPTQQPNITTSLSRRNSFGLIVVPNDGNEANGTLFWDDGESIETYERGEYTLLDFTLKGNNLLSSVLMTNHMPLKLSSVSVLGVGSPVSKVTVNGQAVESFKYIAKFKHLDIANLTTDLQKPFTISWS